MKLKDVKVGMRVAVVDNDGDKIGAGTVDLIDKSTGKILVKEKLGSSIPCFSCNLRPLKPFSASKYTCWLNFYKNYTGEIYYGGPYQHKKDALLKSSPYDYIGTFKMVRAKNQEE